MELQEFIKQTLVQITKGITDAQNELKDTECLINPMGYSSASNQIIEGVQNNSRSIQKIKMNIVLDVTNSSGSNSGIGVSRIIKAGIDNTESKNEKEVTTVEFEIPISFPVMK
jgi:hypothetical protein